MTAAWSLPLLLLLAVGPWYSPKVRSAMPPGAQRGTEVEVVFMGERLQDPLALLGDTEGIEVCSIASDKPERCTVTLRLAEDCALGAHALRLRCAEGLSNLLLFHVGVLPEVRAMPGAEPQSIALGCTVNGDLGADASDRFAVELAAGSEVHCEVEALRLGFAAIDLALSVHGPDGELLARSDDTALSMKDPMLGFTAPRDGSYVITVAAAFAAEVNRGVYRLHVHDSPRPLMAIPCGGQPGQTLEVDLLGCGPPRTVTVTLPKGPCEAWPWFPQIGNATVPTPIYLRVGGPPNVEAKPDAKGRPFVAFPGSVHGLLRAAGQSEHFFFHAEQNQELVFRALARTLRSPLDPVLIVREADGRYLASNDDQQGQSMDSLLRFKAKASGDYQIEVRDLLHTGSDCHAFRLEGDLPQSAMSLRLAVGRRDEAVLEVPRGGHIGGVLQTGGADPNAGVQLLLRDLPEGVSARLGDIQRGTNLVPVLLTASADAPLQGAMVAFAASADQPPLQRDPGYLQELPLVTVRNDQPILRTALDALAVAVTNPAPFAIELLPPTVPILRGAPLQLHVKLQRQAGNKDRVRVRALWTPPGISAGQVVIDADQDHAELPLSASANAMLGSFPFAVVATVYRRGSRLDLASDFATLTIDKPWLDAKAIDVRTEPGRAVELRVALQPQHAIAGSYRLRLLALPRGVEADELQVPADATTATFQLRLADAAQPGRHRSWQIEALLPDAHGEVACRCNGGELRIDRPLGDGAQVRR